MTAPTTDDDLGARLRAVLQDVTPLATDPVPPPRFAPTAVFEPHVGPVAVDAGDLVETGAPPRPIPLTRRRVGVATLLAVAAAAVVTSVLTTDLHRPGDDRSPSLAAGSPTSAPPTATAGQAVVAPVGSVTAYPDVWRCIAPAGRAIAPSLQSDRIDAAQVWVIAAGVTCTARPDEAGKYVFEPHGFGVPGESPAQVGGTKSCLTGWSRIPEAGAIVSRGVEDYVEFYGPGCYLLLPSR